MSTLTGKTVNLLGPTTSLVATIAETLRTEGARVSVVGDAPSPTWSVSAHIAVFVAGAPGDYGLRASEVGAYVGVVVSRADLIAHSLSGDSSTERVVVLVAPSIGSSLAQGAAAVSAAAGALRGLSRAWAVERGAEGIRSNVVLPGILVSDPTSSGATVPAIPLERPAGRLGLESDVAHAVAYLASPDAGYVSGAEVDVDGGLSEDRHSILSVLWQDGSMTPARNPFADLLGKAPDARAGT